MRSDVRQRVLNYVVNLRRPGGGIAFSRQARDTILSTDFAVFTMNLLGETSLLSKQRASIVPYLESAEQEDGTFCDPRYHPDQAVGTHKGDYVLAQFTCYTLTALDILGIHRDTLPFFEPMLDETRARKWFDGLDWSRFWYESNKIMFHFYFLAYLTKYGAPSLQPAVRHAVDTAFEVLNDRQDPACGLWGTDLNHGNVQDGAFGAAHIFLFYRYFNRPIRHPHRILDACLGLHAENGLVGDTEGGACEDYDMADIYLRLLPVIPERRSEIVKVLCKMRDVIEIAQSPEGGFPYRIRGPQRGIGPRLRALLPMGIGELKYQYSSWPVMRTPVYLPDQWGTFFRLLTLQIVDHIVDGAPLRNVYNLPCWGYLTPSADANLAAHSSQKPHSG